MYECIFAWHTSIKIIWNIGQNNLIINILTTSITIEKGVHVLHRLLLIQCTCIEGEIKEEYSEHLSLSE